LRDGGVTLNENILMRLFSKASIEKEAIHRVAFDAGNIFHVNFFRKNQSDKHGAFQ
jgi:hypothetical protein